MFSRLITLVTVALTAMGIAVPASAQQSEADILRTLNFRSGAVTLGDNLADIALTENFRYLNNADTQTFLVKIWGNAPGVAKGALGMILPIDPSPLTAEGWAVVVSYDPSGYVSDDEAGKIDYDELIGDMQKATAEASKQRVQQGQGSIELLGWAQKPYYDASAKKMFWAKRLRFNGSQEETLNYEIRILGRRGVLDLNIVASMTALPSIEQRVQTILSMVRFNKGNTYAEYNSVTDHAAAYGLAGLVAGGVLAKAGFFKGLVALLLASKKLVGIAIFGGFALWARIRRQFTRKPKPVTYSSPDVSDEDEPPMSTPEVHEGAPPTAPATTVASNVPYPPGEGRQSS